MTKYIYVVGATEGEYSDRQEYCICATRLMSKARAHCERAQKWLLQNPRPECGDEEEYEDFEKRVIAWAKTNKFDPFTGDKAYNAPREDRHYWVSKVPLLDENTIKDGE